MQMLIGRIKIKSCCWIVGFANINDVVKWAHFVRVQGKGEGQCSDFIYSLKLEKSFHSDKTSDTQSLLRSPDPRLVSRILPHGPVSGAGCNFFQSTQKCFHILGFVCFLEGKYLGIKITSGFSLFLNPLRHTICKKWNCKHTQYFYIIHVYVSS